MRLLWHGHVCSAIFKVGNLQWQPTPVLLPGKSHGRRGLVGCSPWGRQESDMTDQPHFHFSLSCIGEGNGNPLQCSCLENPRDRGAWWAAVYGVAQSWTRLKRFSSSSSSSKIKVEDPSALSPIPHMTSAQEPENYQGQILIFFHLQPLPTRGVNNDPLYDYVSYS